MPNHEEDQLRIALDGCDAAMVKLERLCCEPGRSPRMAEIAAILAEARELATDLTEDADDATQLLATLERAGGLIGALQVGCCTEARMPLYATVLDGLTTAQISISRSVGLGH